MAVGGDDRPVGLAHLVFHPSTWSLDAYCYLEDLYVEPAARGTGAAQALFGAVYAEADARGAERVYWLTQAYNGAARSLYDGVGHLTSFVVYEALNHPAGAGTHRPATTIRSTGRVAAVECVSGTSSSCGTRRPRHGRTR